MKLKKKTLISELKFMKTSSGLKCKGLNLSFCPSLLVASAFRPDLSSLLSLGEFNRDKGQYKELSRSDRDMSL